MAVQTGKFASGQVLFPNQAPWLTDLETELFTFPNGPHDDQVDSISQALAHRIERAYWDDKALENFASFVEGLSIDRYLGNLMGRPW